jgi:hypothetical protein
MVSPTGVGVSRGRDAEGAGFGNGFTQEVDQSIVDAGIFDTSGGEKEFHDSSPS